MLDAKSPCGGGTGRYGWYRQVHGSLNSDGEVRCTTASHQRLSTGTPQPTRPRLPHLQQLLPHVQQHGGAEAHEAVGAPRRVGQQRVPQAQRVGERKLLRQRQRDPPAGGAVEERWWRGGAGREGGGSDTVQLKTR